MPASSPLRLGIVPFLNVAPLLEGLGTRFREAGWVRATPRELGLLMERGEIDIAMLPIAEALRCGYRILPGAAIASDGPVRSVQVFSKVPVPAIRTVLLDARSLTSVQLARIVLADQVGIAPRCDTAPSPIAADFGWRADPHDAFVVIGDVALLWEHAFPHALDLGEAWRQLTGLPFVYAAWCARRDVIVEEDDLAAFAAARELGETRLSEITREWAPRHGLDPAACGDYLGGAIKFRLGDREREGIAEFGRRMGGRRVSGER